MTQVKESAKLNKGAKALLAMVNFIVITGETKSGNKPVLSAKTTKRLSIEDFKSLMGDIGAAGGYGFTKFYPEHKAKFISATGLNQQLFTDLCNQYTWNEPTPKQPSKRSNDKAAKIAAKQAMTNEGIDLALLDKFKAFLATQGAQ